MLAVISKVLSAFKTLILESRTGIFPTCPLSDPLKVQAWHQAHFYPSADCGRFCLTEDLVAYDGKLLLSGLS